jgi:hypothetical protein
MSNFVQELSSKVKFKTAEEARNYFESSKDDCLVFFKCIYFSVMKKLMEILSVASGDVMFVFTKDKVKMNTLNKNQQIVIHLELNAKEKMTYTQINQQCYLAVNSREFYKKCFKIKDRKSIMYWRILQDEPKNCKVSYLSGKNGNIVSSFNLMSIQEETTSFSCSGFDFSVDIKIKSSTFHRLISEREKNDTFELILDGRSLIIRCCNNLSISREDVILEDGETVIFPDHMPEETKKPISFGEFSVRKLDLFYKTTGISENLILHLNTDDPEKPISTQYILDGGLGNLFIFYTRVQPTIIK